MSRNVKITDLNRDSNGIFRTRPEFILYCANKKGEIRNTYTGGLANTIFYYGLEQLYLLKNFCDMELQTYSRSIFAWECDYGMVDLKSGYNVKITRALIIYDRSVLFLIKFNHLLSD